MTKERLQEQRQNKETKSQIERLVDDLQNQLDKERQCREEVEARLERERRINKMQVRQLKKELADEREKTANQSISKTKKSLAERSFSNISSRSRPKSKSRPVSEHRMLRRPPSEKRLTRDNTSSAFS